MKENRKIRYRFCDGVEHNDALGSLEKYSKRKLNSVSNNDTSCSGNSREQESKNKSDMNDDENIDENGGKPN